jgi:predicted nuclease of predicted toxin-antitoxin system
VKLFLDQNLSRNLVRRLQAFYPDTTHVSLVGLETATDREVWEHGREHGYAIASKDSDFRQLVFLFGPPPKGRLAPCRQCQNSGESYH